MGSICLVPCFAKKSSPALPDPPARARERRAAARRRGPARPAAAAVAREAVEKTGRHPERSFAAGEGGRRNAVKDR